jgi:hypothetical protein
VYGSVRTHDHHHPVVQALGAEAEESYQQLLALPATGSKRGVAEHQKVLTSRLDLLRSRVAEALSLLDTGEEEMPEKLQQVVHMHKSCDGCGDGDDPLYGYRFECKTCDENFCNDCYKHHELTHILSLHRVALPEDLPVPGDEWEILGIDGHRDTQEGRLYSVAWAGNWENTEQRREDTGNDAMIDAYEAGLLGPGRKRGRGGGSRGRP